MVHGRSAALALGALLIAAGSLASGCDGTKPPPAPTAGDTVEGGSIALQLQGTASLTIASVAYTITGPGAFSRTGSIDVGNSTTLSATIGGIPAGMGYSIALSATASDGTTTCSGSAAFDVTAGMTSAIAVHLICFEAPGNGSVIVGGTINVCPLVDGIGANPAEVTLGGTIALTGLAHDSDGGPAPLSYRWTATGGVLDDATAANPNFTCSAVGPVVLTLAVSDGDDTPGCADVQSVTVQCSTALLVQASPPDLAPGQSSTLTATSTDGAPHSWTYAWADGMTGFTAGVFTPAAANTAVVTYAPSSCNALGGGDHAILLTVTVVDPALATPEVGTTTVTVHCPGSFYTTKTPYQPFQDPATLGAAPAGFQPVFVETVGRHGSRGLSSLKYDAAMLALWTKAQSDGALTALGASLGPDIQKLMRANALLDVGVPGISNPGYGNLTQVGINEQKQLAVRLLQRLPDYFAGVAATAGTATPRQIVVISSGVDRAVDSAAFFTQSLTATNPALAPLVTQPPAPVGYPANAPVVQPAGTNRFLLYFHKLVPATDLVTNAADPYYPTYQDSQAFQAYASDADLTAKLTTVLADPEVVTASRAILEGLFAPTFVDKLANGTYTFANTGTFTFTSDDGTYTTTLTGDGKTKVKSLPDAASMLYNLYVVAPAMTAEAGVDFTKYLPADQAQVLAYLQDAQDFYQMGPGIQEANPVTYKMAQALENDFFTEIDAIAAGDLSHGAKLRFTHAEIIVPFANLLGLPGAATAVPKAQTYTYATNPWRGQMVSQMATNQQWEVFRNATGTVLVRLLYNEKEIDFKPACASARFAPGTHFYEYGALKTCYGR